MAWLSGLSLLAGFVLLFAGALAPNAVAAYWAARGPAGLNDFAEIAGGGLIGFGLAATLLAPALERTAAAVAAALSLAAFAGVAAASGQGWAVRLGLAVIGVALLALIFRRDLAAAGADPGGWRVRPIWLAAAGPALLLAPTLMGDPEPARHALALCLGVGALALAVFAAFEARAGRAFEVEVWDGGLGGGRSGFSLSRPLALTLLALALAGAAATAALPPAAPPAPAHNDGKGKTGDDKGKDDKTGAPDGAAK